MALTTNKRQNFDVTVEQEAEIALLQSAFGAGSAKDAILKAVHLTLVLAREVKDGKRIGTIDHRNGGVVTEILVPEFEYAASSRWLYLVERPHSWKKQLFVKGRKLTAAQVWLDMRANQMTPADAMDNWNLPAAAVAEILDYCEHNRDLLAAEANEERLHLQTHGVSIEK